MYVYTIAAAALSIEKGKATQQADCHKNHTHHLSVCFAANLLKHVNMTANIMRAVMLTGETVGVVILGVVEFVV